MAKQGKPYTLESENDRIALMAIYRDEWQYRDQTFASYLWRLVYLSLIITFLPNFLDTLDTSPEIVNRFPSWVFPVAGIFCSLLGLYIGLASIKRIRSVDEAYKNLAKHFPADCRVEKYQSPYLKISLNKLLVFCLYGSTIALAVMNLMVMLP